jgi:hypothetical protein
MIEIGVEVFTHNTISSVLEQFTMTLFLVFDWIADVLRSFQK